MKFEAKQFDLKNLEGLSEKNIETHLKLYQGYVTHTNLILDLIEELKKDSEKNAYALAEVNRRFGFEFDGMRLHEYFFGSLSGGSVAPDTASSLYNKLSEQYGSFDNWINEFKAVAMSRGIGWSILYYDKRSGLFKNTWVSDHELGHLATLNIVMLLDMWEHAYFLDYLPAEKKNYIETIFKNLNWKTIEDNFAKNSI